MQSHNGTGASVPARVPLARLIYIAAPLLALLFVIGWRIHQIRAAAAAQTRQRAAQLKARPQVAVATARVMDIVNTFDALGSIETPDQVKLSAKVTGRLTSLSVQPGDQVSRGELLAQIDPTEVEAQVQQQQQAVNSAAANYNQTREDYASQVAAAEAAVTDARGKVAAANAQIQNARAAIASAQANVINARAQFNRTDTLYHEGATPAQNEDVARATLGVEQGALGIAKSQLNAAIAARDSALAQLQAAENQANIARTKGLTDIQAAQGQVGQARGMLANVQAQLSDTGLRSPIDGYVTSRALDPGAVVTPGETILTLQYVQQVWVTVAVPVELSSQVTMGQTATVTVDGLPGRTFSGRVTQLAPAADPVSRQVTVRLTLQNPGFVLKPGMYARVSLVTQRTPQAVVVPPEAVHTGRGGTTVSVVGPNGVVQVRKVVTGASDPSHIAIVKGVSPGDRVVTLSTVPVKNGQAVQIGPGRGAAHRGRGSSRGRAKK